MPVLCSGKNRFKISDIDQNAFLGKGNKSLPVNQLNNQINLKE